MLSLRNQVIQCGSGVCGRRQVAWGSSEGCRSLKNAAVFCIAARVATVDRGRVKFGRDAMQKPGNASEESLSAGAFR
jgi:hypothetical protein